MFETAQPATKKLTLEALWRLSPALARLRDDVRAVSRKRRGRDFCANATWYTLFKPRLVALVGWHAQAGTPAELRTMEAYDTAYFGLYDMLPGCRRCGCL